MATSSRQIVSSPLASQGTQAWDRYAYVNNSPVNFTDPTGHRLCDGNKDCQAFVNSRIKIYYGITLKGNWSPTDKRNLSKALDKLNNTLGSINKFTTGATYSFTYDALKYGGETKGGNIAFHGWTGGIPYQNYYHEIGHAIDNLSGDYFTEALNARIVLAQDGTFVMGGPKTDYQRNSDGYQQSRIYDPSGRTVDAQQHPGNAPCAANDGWCTIGNTSDEEWADLVANYTADNFVTDPADPYYKYGITRRNWIANIWAAYMMTPSMRFHYR